MKRTLNVDTPFAPHIVDVNGTGGQRTRRFTPVIAPDITLIKAINMNTRRERIRFFLRLCHSMAGPLSHRTAYGEIPQGFDPENL